MASFTDVYDYVMMDVRGVEPATVDFLTRQVCRDMLKTSTLWRETIQLTVQPGLVDYTLRPRSGGMVAGILNVGSVDANSRPVPNMDEGNRPGPGQVLDPGKPDGWWSLYPGIISLQRPPDDAYTIPVVVYKQLTLDPEDTLIPDALYDNYVEALAYGIKARLHAMPAKPWTDTSLATVNNTFYTKAKFAMRAKIRDGGATSHSRVRAPLFTGR